ncbi:MAG: hypothetical protein ACE5I1_11425, partial [bacterium]
MATVSEIQGVLKLKGGDRFARQVRSKLDNVKKSFLNLNTAIKGAGFFLFAKKAIDAANIQEQAVARLGAALKSTNNEIGLTVQQLRKMASGFQKVGIFGDEVVMQAQAILLTFTKIGKDIFPEATEIVLDLRAALDQDLKTSAIQLGKALNDPIRGMDTMSRSGIQFSIEQKKVIKGLVNTGNLFEAQKLILKELNTQFGGMNRQLAETSA